MKLLKSLLLASVMICVLAGSAMAQKANTFESVDANGDGKITWEEFTARYPNVKKDRFDKFAGQDGFMNQTEWNKAKKSIISGNPRREQREAGNPSAKD